MNEPMTHARLTALAAKLRDHAIKELAKQGGSSAHADMLNEAAGVVEAEALRVEPMEAEAAKKAEIAARAGAVAASTAAATARTAEAKRLADETRREDEEARRREDRAASKPPTGRK